jgi:hypothetical protein
MVVGVLAGSVEAIIVDVVGEGEGGIAIGMLRLGELQKLLVSVF